MFFATEVTCFAQFPTATPCRLWVEGMVTDATAHGSCLPIVTMSPPDTAAFVWIDDEFVPVSTCVYEYLKWEAARRGVSAAEILREELAAAEKLKRIELPRDLLEKAAQRDYRNHPWLQGEEEKPF